MIEWFQGRHLPDKHKVLILNQGQKILDIEKYVDANISIVRAQNPCTHIWLNCYMRLYQLKKHIEQNESN